VNKRTRVKVVTYKPDSIEETLNSELEGLYLEHEPNQVRVIHIHFYAAHGSSETAVIVYEVDIAE
jgi:hypothetical protein